MPDTDTPPAPPPPATDTEGDDGGDHNVPADLVEIHEAVDYLERVTHGPHPAP